MKQVTNKKQFSNLSLITNLEVDICKEIDGCINLLQVNDLQGDNFEFNFERIKAVVFLEEVEFKPGKLLESVEDGMGAYIHTVTFPYEGSHKLFGYKPRVFSHKGKDFWFLVPIEGENPVVFTFESSEKNPDKVISLAKDMLGATERVVKANFNALKPLGTEIRLRMETKRDELLSQQK
jgi:hypothetical protein